MGSGNRVRLWKLLRRRSRLQVLRGLRKSNAHSEEGETGTAPGIRAKAAKVSKAKTKKPKSKAAPLGSPSTALMTPATRKKRRRTGSENTPAAARSIAAANASTPGAAPEAGAGAGAGAVFLRHLLQLHEHLASAGPGGLPLNAMILSFLGQQAIAACCHELLQWSCLGPQRLRYCRYLNDARGAPYAPLERVATRFVHKLYLSNEGREDLDARVQVLTKCSRAEWFVGIYCNLAGIGAKLDWGNGVVPFLNLRRFRTRQCSLTAADLVMLLRAAPHLEALVFVNEPLTGIEAVLAERPPPPCKDLLFFEVTDCGLSAHDAAAMLTMAPQLRAVHLQILSLTGLGRALKTSLNCLTELRAADCGLDGWDARCLLRCCPRLEVLDLCGNNLRLSPEDEEHVPTSPSSETPHWPRMNHIAKADFRHCNLDEQDEEALLEALPSSAEVQFRVVVEGQGASTNSGEGASAPGHVVFEDSSEED